MLVCDMAKEMQSDMETIKLSYHRQMYHSNSTLLVHSQICTFHPENSAKKLNNCTKFFGKNCVGHTEELCVNFKKPAQKLCSSIFHCPKILEA